MSTFLSTNSRVFTVVQCVICGCDFGLPEIFEQQRREDHRNFYCPCGHGLTFHGESETEKLRRALTNAQTRAEHWQGQYSAAERSKRAYKGQLTRTKNRVGNGVCPCCNRHFTNLERHMHSQHPAYAAPNEET